MRSLRAFFFRLPELWRKQSRDRRLDEELSYAVEMETAAGLDSGLSPQQARRAALMRVQMEITKEQYRDRRGLPPLESFLQDLRFGLRTLRKNPGFAAVALLTVALGIGANTAMFSAVNAVLLRNLPFSNPDRLVMIWEKSSEVHETLLAERIPVRLQSYLYWQSKAQSFDGISAALYDAVNISGTEKPQHVERAAISSNFLSVLATAPVIGRPFTSDENHGDSRVALISYGLYERQFGKARDILDRTIKVEGVENRIVGVLPQSFHLTSTWGGFDLPKPEVWTPLNTNASQPMEQQRENVLMIYGRLKPGVSLERARSEIALLESQLVQQFPKEYDKLSANMFSLYAEDVRGDLQRSLLVLQLAVGFVLLIACVNVANLLLARAAGREREIALRVALGARRSRVVRQMLSESLVFSLLGATAGLLLAWGGIQVLSKLAPEEIHGLHEMSLDIPVLLFTAGIALLAGLLFGLAPALHAARQQLSESISRGGRANHAGMSRRFRTALVVAEIALALAPLAGAGLMIRSLRALNALDLGLDPQHAFDGHISLPEIQYKTPAQLLTFGNQLLDRVKALPNVDSAALTGSPPMESINFTGFRLEGDGPDVHRTVDLEAVSDGYFQAVGAPILKGRTFTRADGEQDARVLV
ncbi:MAG TPA: ABC transporter permease, partial [Terriglobales bacterium]|nr:ABC transporter permease [Terriglobales bacterium]